MADIRAKTTELLKAYRDLTGADYTPSLPEFLELRRQAIEECRTGIGEAVKATTPATGTTNRQPPNIPRPADIKPITTTVREVHEVREEPEERNGFAILSSLADPWN